MFYLILLWWCLHTFSALAGVHVGSVNTLGPIFTGGAGALINVELALATRESWEGGKRKKEGVNTKIPPVCTHFIPPHSSIQHGLRSLIPNCKLYPSLSGFQAAFQQTIRVRGGEGCKMAVKTFQGLLTKGTRQRGTVYSVARQAMPVASFVP